MKEKDKKYSPKAETKINKVMGEMKAGKLHSGSKEGPIVSDPKQGLAIAINEAKRKGLKVGGKR